MNIKEMKDRGKVLGILFLFVSCLLCSSCNKDDDDILPIRLQYAIYNDKPNQVMDNQVTLDFPQKTKTELVILDGDGDYSVSNTDSTKLSVKSNNEYLELTPLALGNAVITIKDRHNNFYILNVQIKNLFRININAKEENGNIFGKHRNQRLYCYRTPLIIPNMKYMQNLHNKLQ